MAALADSFPIEIETEYVVELSVPEQHRYFFTYTITIQNPLPHSVNLNAIQLLLTNGEGEQIELHNPFAQEKHIIASQQTLCHSNDVITHSPLSIVQGNIALQITHSEIIKINIVPFRLVTPNLLH